jgi:DNA polymerase-3 subunit epsilon
MTPSSVSINGITQKMIDEQGIPLKDALQRFIYFIGDLPLVAYNAPFDLGFLKRAARKYDFLFSNVGSSVLKMTRRAFPGLPSYRLGDVANSLNIQHVGYHRALTDCMLAKNVYDLCEKKLQSNQNSEGVKDGRLL